MFRAGRIHLIPYLIIGFDTIEISYPDCDKPATEGFRVCARSCKLSLPLVPMLLLSGSSIVAMQCLKQQACTKFNVFEKKCEISVFTWSSGHNLMILIRLSGIIKNRLSRLLDDLLRRERSENVTARAGI